jgi:O-acetyl-ADP-ribose deacetylase (regulator of RNase III)
VPACPGVPALEEIVADLRVLRERGLVRLRHADLPALSQAAARTSVLAAAGGGPGAIEALVRAAVENLGGGCLGAAAAATFGLARGARDMPASDRRRRAALVYGVSVERFRKYHERIVMEQVAEEILKWCIASAPPPRGDADRTDIGRQLALDGRAGDMSFPLVVHIEPVELLSGVDIVVVPENIYLELPQPFKSSVSAAVRRAAAVRGPDGRIITDVMADELQSWIRRNGRPGLPVAPGTVVATSSGSMASHGVRRIYHAAVAAPRPGTNDYDIEPTAIAHAVRNVFALARAERQRFDPALRSLGFPLLGAGRGGLHPATSFAWIWTPLEREIADGSPWEIHFITRCQPTADLIIARLAEAGAICELPGQAG